jgi:hypothetical protein
MERQLSGAERRRYRRLDHIFPVEFLFMDETGLAMKGWRQAFTQDISSGGLCLIVNQVPPDELACLKNPAMSMALCIHIPLKGEGVRATARPVWVKPIKEGLINQYIVGVTYDKIDDQDGRRIMRHVTTRVLLKSLAAFFTVGLGVALVAMGFYNAHLRLHNDTLLKDLTDNVVHQQELERGRQILAGKISEVEFLMAQADRRVEQMEYEKKMAGSDEKDRLVEIETSLDLYKRYQEKIKGDLSDLKEKSVQVEQEAGEALSAASTLGKKVVDKFYEWLSTHQNNRTGLVVSFEGDENIRNWGFTYDQALASMVFVRFGAYDRAREIFDFYRRAEKIDNGAWTNAYDVSDGRAAEYIAHVGPNVWLGLAVLQYTRRTGDKAYLDIAQAIARWLDGLRDAEGGLKGGKTVTWCSTEHNLDAYAFYRMLFALAGDPRDKARADETLAWLNKNAYSYLSSTPIKRGKGDATIATDTYAWSIAAVGPQTLKDSGMDPDQIMDFAAANCGVDVTCEKPDGSPQRVCGFDFAKPQHVARGGVVSCEWTAQMILSFKIMAAYHRSLGEVELAQAYETEARDHAADLVKLAVTSPSSVGQGGLCLPYASHEMVDTGHGWRTPRGTRTGSLAATAYAILAIEGFNPLAFDEQPV